MITSSNYFGSNFLEYLVVYHFYNTKDESVYKVSRLKTL
jgi:peptidase E